MLKISEGRRDLVVSLIGRAVSTFGDGIALIALTLRLQADGARPYEVGLLLAAGSIPPLLLARPVGRLVDSVDSRRLLVTGCLVEIAATAPLVVVHSVVPMVVLAAVLGVATAMTTATWSALVPRIVGEDQMAAAVSMQQVLGLLAYVGAPAAGGLLVAGFGTGLPVALDVGTYVVMTVAAMTVRTRRTPERAPATTGPMRGGLAIVGRDPVLAPLLAGAALVLLLVGVGDVVLVYLVRHTLHATGTWYGLVEGSWVAGMALGAVGSSQVVTERGQVRAAAAGMMLACAATAAFALAPAAWVLIPLSVLGGVGNGYAGACVSVLLVTRTPDSARGRVSASVNAALGGTQGASFVAGGLVATALTPRTMYAAAGLLGLAASGAVAIVTGLGRDSQVPE